MHTKWLDVADCLASLSASRCVMFVIRSPGEKPLMCHSTTQICNMVCMMHLAHGQPMTTFAGITCMVRHSIVWVTLATLADIRLIHVHTFPINKWVSVRAAVGVCAWLLTLQHEGMSCLRCGSIGIQFDHIFTFFDMACLKQSIFLMGQASVLETLPDVRLQGPSQLCSILPVACFACQETMQNEAWHTPRPSYPPATD